MSYVNVFKDTIKYLLGDTGPRSYNAMPFSDLSDFIYISTF